MNIREERWRYKDEQVYRLDNGNTIAHLLRSDNTDTIGIMMAAAPLLLDELLKARDLIEVLTNELNYKSVRWSHEHLYPINYAIDEATHVYKKETYAKETE